MGSLICRITMHVDIHVCMVYVHLKGKAIWIFIPRLPTLLPNTNGRTIILNNFRLLVRIKPSKEWTTRISFLAIIVNISTFMSFKLHFQCYVHRDASLTLCWVILFFFWHNYTHEYRKMWCTKSILLFLCTLVSIFSTLWMAGNSVER